MLRILPLAALLLLTACASAPETYCIPPGMDRAPDPSGDLGARSVAAEKEYAACKEREADARLEQQLKEDEARARQREAERLEQERREMQKKWK